MTYTKLANGGRPDRSPGNITPKTKAAEDDKLLTGPEAAMVAAVRTAYSVANDQIERSAKLAQRLRGDLDKSAGGRAEPLDAASRTVLRATLAWLEWLETGVTDDSLGARISTILGADPKSVERPTPASAATSSVVRNVPYVEVVVRGKAKRTVKVTQWDVQPGKEPVKVEFRYSRDLTGEPLKATLTNDPNADVRCKLTFAAIDLALPSGVWRAGVFEKDVQRGFVEIEL